MRVAILIVIVVAFVWFALVTGTSRVSAATFTVINLNDSGPGSLRQAILDANANPGTDTIEFGAGVTGTITLMSIFQQVTGDLTITGPGAVVLTVSGNSSLRIFNIAPGVTASISGLTIRLSELRSVVALAAFDLHILGHNASIFDIGANA